MDTSVMNGTGQFRSANGTAGKKMRKRRELDALVSHPSLSSAGKRLNGSRDRHTDEVYLAESTDDEEFYWSSSGREKASGNSGNVRGSSYLKSRGSGVSSSSYLKRGGVKSVRSSRSWRSGFLRACSFVFVFTCIVSTCSVLYLFLDIRQQCSYLRHELDEVVAGSQGVPDALQKCHSLSKQLERNQTELANKFSSMTVQIKNFSIQISTLHDTVSALEDKLSASPQVLDVPARLSELANNVASFGSTLNDLTNTVAKLKEAGGRLSAENGALRANVSSLKESIETLQQRSVPGSADQSAKLESALTQLSSNLTQVNDTLSARLTFLHDDQTKNHVHLEDLESVNANLSSRVSSVTQDVTSLTSSLARVTQSVTLLDSSLATLRDGLRQLNVSVSGALPSSPGSTSSVLLDVLEKVNPPSGVASSQRNLPDVGVGGTKGDAGDLGGSIAPQPTSTGPFDLNLLPSVGPTSGLEATFKAAAGTEQEDSSSTGGPRVIRK